MNNAFVKYTSLCGDKKACISCSYRNMPAQRKYYTGEFDDSSRLACIPDHMWEVHIDERGLTNMKSLSDGVYRMYLAGRNLGFIRLNEDSNVFELPVS